MKDYQKLSQIENAENGGWLKTKGGAYLKDVPLGEGIVNVNACLQILKEADYLSVYSLELVEPTVNSPSAMKLVQTLLQAKN